MKKKEKDLGPNPKDILGMKKLSLSKLPGVALLHGAHAMMNGGFKYGPYNWRGKKVLASIYIDAIKRHVEQWEDREEVALDSKVHHLGHLIASAAILLDAQATGNLIDDRPPATGNIITKELDRLSKVFTDWVDNYAITVLKKEKKVGYGTKVKRKKK